MVAVVVRGVGSGQPCTEYEDSDTEVGVTRYALSGVCHRFVCRGIATPTRRATVLGAIPFQFVPNGMQNRMQQCLYVPACTGYVKTSLGPLGPRYAATRTRIFRLLNRSLSLSPRIRDERFVETFVGPTVIRTKIRAFA